MIVTVLHERPLTELIKLQQPEGFPPALLYGLPKSVSIGNGPNLVYFTREQVAELVKHLSAWVETGSLQTKEPDDA
jgi:hypothetical protein